MIFRWWQNLSVSKKLFSVVGVMALLIATELFTLYFAMNTLSAVRAFVGGEGLWSKAEKNAVYNLQRYAITRSESNYNSFLEELKVPLGDHQARVEMEKPQIDMDVINRTFAEGHIHPSDVPQMVKLVRRFYGEPHLAKALDKWRLGDDLIFKLIDFGNQLHQEVKKEEPDQIKIESLMNQISRLDIDITQVENDFSYALGEASRWLENVLMLLLLAAVVTIEGTGLFLTFRFGQSLTRVLRELNQAAILVGQGDLSQKVAVHSKDELGQLAKSINDMIENLEKQTNERQSAEHASQAKNLFLANMSHEIRTPLNAILGFSDLLQDPSISEQDKVRYAAIIKRTGASLTTIINDILDVAKVEAEQIKMDLTRFSLKQLLSDLYVLLRMRCEEKHIQLLFEQKGDVSEFIYSDQTRLRQILANIVGNSIKFTSKGFVKLTYEVQDSSLIFTVQDSGAGVTKEQQAQLFKPFSQGDNSVRKKYGGTGLGLVLSQKLAQLLGGDVGLLESRPNVGSTFLVRISYVPVRKDQVVSAPTALVEKEISGLPLLNKKVLVVEDSPDNQILAQLYLSKSGASVQFADNGEEGVTKATDEKFDIILMDIQMPIMDGYSATSELRRQQVDTPIIALTGYAMKEDQERCLSVGCNDYISKPFDQKKLIKTILKNLNPVV